MCVFLCFNDGCKKIYLISPFFSHFFIFSLSSSILPLSPYFLHFVFLFCFSFFSFVIPLFRFILFWSQTDRSTNRWPRLLIEMVLDAKLHFYHIRHVPNHSESLKFHFSPNLTKALPTNRPTNQPTNGRTDRRTRPLIEMRTHLKTWTLLSSCNSYMNTNHRNMMNT